MALHRSLIIILFTATALPGLGQSFVPLEIRYSRLPQAEVKQADNETFKGLERGPLQVLEGHFGFPIRLKKHGVLFIPKISYARYYQSLNLWEESQDALGNAHLLGFNFSGIVPVSSRLSFTGSFGVDQAVGENSSWSLENNLYKFAVGFLFKLGDAHKAGISVAYTQILDVPIPIIIYQRTSENDRWAINLKLPMSGTIDYNISQNTAIRWEERFNAGGRFALADAKDETSFYNSAQATMSLGVKQRIKGPLFMHLAGGFTLWDKTRLFDHSDNEVDVLRYVVPGPTFNFSIFMNIHGKS